MKSARVASWPGPSDYQDVLQRPDLCFRDPELRAGAVDLDILGLPHLRTGAMASTASVHVDGRRWAVRCFIRAVPDDRLQRCQAVADHLGRRGLPFTTAFDYITEGILAKNAWRPVVKMHWVDGEWLNAYVGRLARTRDRQGLTLLASRWLALIGELQANEIAHGDLQHGNVLVTDRGELRLVDYDGTFVPALLGLRAQELGHPNYQHPGRSERHFGPYLDNFSALAVYVALTALAWDPGLWAWARADESILWTSSDFRDPGGSRLFRRLMDATQPDLVRLNGLLRDACTGAVEAVPALPSVVSRLHVCELAAGRVVAVRVPAAGAGERQLVPAVRATDDRSTVRLVITPAPGPGRNGRLRVRLRRRLR